MEAILRRIEQPRVPPYVLHRLGLSQSWWRVLSPEFVKQVAKTAEERRKVLDELAKY